MEQSNIFGLLYPNYKIKNPIRLIELFAGVGSQAMALRDLGCDFEHHQVIEFDKYAIKSYNAIHDTNFETSDIRDVHGTDLKVTEKNKYTYLLTYSFPCFSGDTLILTSKGLKKISNVKEGEYVLTHTNKYQKVIASKITGTKQTYIINGMAFDSLRVTMNHKFLVREKYRAGHKNVRTFKSSTWKALNEITNKDYFGVAINQNEVIPKWNGITFEWSDGRRERHKNELSSLMENHSFWWLIGRYIGDGWIRQQGGIIICCSKKEIQEIPTHVRNCNFNYSVSEEDSTYKIHISKKELELFVSQFGKGASCKKLTNTIIDLPVNYLKSFIDGYISADGYNNGKTYKVSSVSKELIYSFAQCVAKAFKTPYRIYRTKRPKTCTIKGRVVNQKDTYEVVWKTKKCKQDKAFYENGYIWFPIRSIEKYGIEDVYDIEVECDHSFTANGVIAHNCQDLSKAGKQKGMSKGDNTRSGLLWEVERILNELKESNQLPQVLLMENVPDVIGTKNYPDFMKWYAALESMGYQSYYKVLNAKDFGIPQNRARCFMISTLGEYNYEFPKSIPLELRLKDMLEETVDEKYYLSEKMVSYFQNHSKNCEEKGNGFRFKTTDGNGIAKICTGHLSQTHMDDNYIKVYGNSSGGKWDTTNESCRRVYSPDGIGPTITAMGGGYQEPKIAEIKEPLICASRGRNPENPKSRKSGLATEQMIEIGSTIANTLTTVQKDNMVIIPEATQKGYAEAYEGDYVNLAYPDSTTRRSRVGKQVANTLLCNDNNGVVVSDAKIIQKGHGYVQDSENAICPSITSSAFHENNFVKEANGVYTNDSEEFRCNPLKGLSRTLKANNHDAGIVENNCRIRKLTPLECWRLMGFTDDDFYKAAQVNSNSQLYKQAGNSIVKQVLMAIFKGLL